MKRLNEAYEVLSDSERKAAYDELLESLERRQATYTSFTTPAAPPRTDLKEELTAEAHQYGTYSGKSKRDFNGHRRQDSEASGQRGYFGGKQKSRIQLPKISTIFVICLFSFGAYNWISSHPFTEKSTPQQKVATTLTPTQKTNANAVATSPSKSLADSPIPSKYPACVRVKDQVKCEQIEAAKEFTATQDSTIRAAAARAGIALSKNPNTLSGSQNSLTPQIGLPIARSRNLSCQSSVTLNLNSTNYRGRIDVQLRIGSRPGSTLFERAELYSSGIVVVTNVCPGTYFFAFSTPDSESVSTTRYFTVESNWQGYNNPEITVTYSRSLSPNTQRVGSARREDL